MHVTEPRNLEIRRVDYLLRQPRPITLIDQILARDSVAVIASQPYIGKTFLALDLMRAVAYGTPFLGNFTVPKTGNVLYLGNDSPAWDLASQFNKLIGLPDPKVEDVGMLLDQTALGAFGFVFDTAFVLETAADAERVVTAATRHTTERFYVTHTEDDDFYQLVSGTDLIVIDTLRSVHGFDENDNMLMQHMMNMLRYIATRTKAAVVALHHFNKGNKESEEASLDRLRGATCVGGAVDTVYALTKKSPGAATKVHVLKNRPFPDTREFFYETHPTPDGIMLKVASVTDMETKMDETYDWLMAQPDGWVRTEALPPYANQRVLASLEKKGRISRIHGAVRLATTGGVN